MTEKTVQPQIKIPRASEKEVVNVPSGTLGDISKKFEKIDQILFGIMIAVVLSLVAIIVSVIGLFLDQMRFNNVVYKEYTEKINTLDSLKDSNRFLLEQNKESQNIIIEQQRQIIEDLNKK